MTVYTWKIHSVVKRTIQETSDVVFNAVWEKFGITEDGYSGSVKSSVSFEIGDIDPSLFVQYDQLTEEIIVSWVKNFINEDIINQNIEQEIEKARSHWMHVDEENLPWNVVREE